MNDRLKFRAYVEDFYFYGDEKKSFMIYRVAVFGGQRLNIPSAVLCAYETGNKEPSDRIIDAEFEELEAKPKPKERIFPLTAFIMGFTLCLLLMMICRL